MKCLEVTLGGRLLVGSWLHCPGKGLLQDSLII